MTHQAQQSHEQILTSPLTTTLSLQVDRKTLLYLRQEAAARDTTVACLIIDLLDVVATDKLVGAVLDR
jgi:hypothetical protein